MVEVVTEEMAGAATGRHREIRNMTRSSETSQKNESKSKCPEKTKWRKSVSGNVCLDNPDVVIDRMMRVIAECDVQQAVLSCIPEF
jgi:hypothetical protein